MIYLIFIPWILFFISYLTSILIHIKKENTDIKIITWLKSNLIKTIRLDILLLVGVFIYFVHFDNLTVTKMLFFMINLYLFVNILYDIPKKEFKNINIKIIILFLSVTLIPVIYYLITKNFEYTCIFMFIFNFLAYYICILLIKIEKLLFKTEK